MIKKSVCAVLFSLIFSIMLGTSAFATEETVSPEIAEALAEVEEVNAEIYAEIAAAQTDGNSLYEEYLSEYAEEADSEKRATLTQEFEKEITKIIDELDAKTQEMTRIGVEKATAAGVDVKVVWIPVEIADRVVMIDPMVVIGW